jgi:hypothetical protein
MMWKYNKALPIPLKYQHQVMFILQKEAHGYGSIFADDGKKMTWVCNLNTSLQNEIIYLQPGNYKWNLDTRTLNKPLIPLKENLQ